MDGWPSSNRGEWERLSKANIKDIPDDPGVYEIATNKPLRRAVGVDAEGRLDIGESARLRTRLNKFLACAEKRQLQGHAAGMRYAKLKLDLHFPLSILRFRWVKKKSKGEASKTEKRLLREYARVHGELPPLNHRL